MAPTYQFQAEDIIKGGRVKTEDFQQMKTWCQSHKLPPLNDEQIILFLLSTDSDLETTKHTIQSYFKCKSRAFDIFGGRNMEAEDLRQLIEVCEYTVLPARTSNNEAVISWKMKDYTFYKFNIHSVLKMLLMAAELPLYRDPPDGLIIVIDQKGFSLLHLTRLRYGPLKNYFQYLQEGFPCKLKHIHILNTVYFIDKMLKIVRPLMSEELFKKITFHPSSLTMGEFYEFVPMRCLPQDYGGMLASVSDLSERTYGEFQELKEFYSEEEEQIRLYKYA